MNCKIRLLITDYELDRSISILVTIPTSVFSRYFCFDGEASLDFSVLKEICSPRQFARITPYSCSKVRHSADGFFVEHKFFVTLLKVYSL